MSRCLAIPFCAQRTTISFADPLFSSIPLHATAFKVTGIRANNAHVYKSALLPLGLDLETTKGTYGILFKNGDDLRQDQLVLQVIRLMDRLLKKENLDLHLTPYECLAASTVIGMVQRIPSEPIAKILSVHGSITKYLREGNEDPSAPNEIKRRVIDNFVCSCAGARLGRGWPICLLKASESFFLTYSALPLPNTRCIIGNSNCPTSTDTILFKATVSLPTFWALVIGIWTTFS